MRPRCSVPEYMQGPLATLTLSLTFLKPVAINFLCWSPSYSDDSTNSCHLQRCFAQQNTARNGQADSSNPRLADPRDTSSSRAGLHQPGPAAWASAGRTWWMPFGKVTRNGCWQLRGDSHGPSLGVVRNINHRACTYLYLVAWVATVTEKPRIPEVFLQVGYTW